jgi:flagellar protein FliO/FliZ
MAAQKSKFKLEEILFIDQKRKIVSIRREDKTYVLLLGNVDQLIEINKNV